MTNKFRKLTIYIITICIGLPISIYKVGDTGELDIPLAMITVFVSLPFIFLGRLTKEKKCFAVTIFFAFISIIINMVIYRKYELRPFLSLTYFFIPYVLYFSGYYLFKEYEDIKSSITLLSWLFLSVSVSVFYSIISAGGLVRLGGELLGTLWGFRLYATYGVNTLAVYYATMFIVLVINVFYIKHKFIKYIIFLPGLISLIYLLIGSLSREALVGVIGFVCFSIIRLYNRNKLLALLCCLVMYGLYNAGNEQYGDIITKLWSSKLELGSESLANKDLDSLTSGRGELYKAAISDIGLNPYWGTGFFGFQLNHDTESFKYDISTSPHIQYLTALWKMGLIASVFYFRFLYLTLSKSYFLTKIEHKGLYDGLCLLIIIYVCVFNLMWDVFLVPLLGMIIMFFAGGLSRIYNIRRIQV